MDDTEAAVLGKALSQHGRQQNKLHPWGFLPNLLVVPYITYKHSLQQQLFTNHNLGDGP